MTHHLVLRGKIEATRPLVPEPAHYVLDWACEHLRTGTTQEALAGAIAALTDTLYANSEPFRTAVQALSVITKAGA